MKLKIVTEEKKLRETNKRRNEVIVSFLGVVWGRSTADDCDVFPMPCPASAERVVQGHHLRQ